MMGFGWILRDDGGQFVVAASIPWKGNFKPKEAEAFAMKETLSWLKTYNFDQVHIESNAKLVVQGLKSELNDSSFDMILYDINDSIRHFSQVVILFVKRSAN